MTDNLLKTQAFKLKGRLYTFTVLKLLSSDKHLFEQQLQEVVAKAPRMFDNSPVVLDCSALLDDELDLDAFCQCMRAYNMFPVAIQSNNPLLGILAQSRGMPVLHASSSHDKPLNEAPQPEIEVATSEILTNKLQTAPVRSGQQVVCKGGDLVIISSVSQGAELLADGNIHVYGALRGRALAGISGDRNARIFCQSLEAELLSIAGFYRLSDAIEPRNGPCQIYLNEEHICIEPLC